MSEEERNELRTELGEVALLFSSVMLLMLFGLLMLALGGSIG